MQRICFVFLCVLVVLCAILGFMCDNSTIDTVYPLSFSDTVLVIDAGHGGEDGGAISLTGVPESHLNLAVAKRLDLVLGLFGVSTLPLREEDVSLHNKSAQTLRQKKNSDLHNRADMVNEQENAILLSVHQNSYPDGRYSGAHAFYAPTEGSR